MWTAWRPCGWVWAWAEAEARAGDKDMGRPRAVQWRLGGRRPGGGGPPYMAYAPAEQRRDCARNPAAVLCFSQLVGTLIAFPDMPSAGPATGRSSETKSYWVWPEARARNSDMGRPRAVQRLLGRGHPGGVGRYTWVTPLPNSGGSPQGTVP
jgi:hypothetical protein